MDALEGRLMEAIALTNYQLDARLNAFYTQADRELGEFSKVLETKFKDNDFQNIQKMITFKSELEEELRKMQARGQLR
jgi:hypothetical protein